MHSAREDWESLARRDIDYHRDVATQYDEQVRGAYGIYEEHFLGPLLDELVVRHGTGLTALDIGCGTGGVTLHLAQRGFRTHGVDHSPEMLSIARERASELGLEVDLRTGDARELPFRDQSVDLVTCQGVLHHLPSLEPVITEADRVLRPGGTLYISEPCTRSTPLSWVWNRAVAIAIRARRALRRASTDAGFMSADHERPLHTEEILARLDDVGLTYEIEYLAHFDSLERLLPDAARLRLTRLASAPWRRRRGDILFVRASKREPPRTSRT